MILEYKEVCSNCSNVSYLGQSGIDHEGVHVAYLCPNCGNETPDIIPDVDDILPGEIAWYRAPNGTIHWYIVPTPISLLPSKMIWCDRCQCFVSEKDLKRWTGDDALHRLCPGCDTDLLPVGELE